MLAGFIFAVFPTFAGRDLLGVAPKKGNPQANSGKAKNPGGPNVRRKGSPKKNSKKPKTPEQIRREKQAKALEEQRKRIAEQRRRRQEAEAKRRKELQEDKKRRNDLRFASLRKEISELQ